MDRESRLHQRVVYTALHGRCEVALDDVEDLAMFEDDSFCAGLVQKLRSSAKQRKRDIEYRNAQNKIRVISNEELTQALNAATQNGDDALVTLYENEKNSRAKINKEIEEIFC